MRTADFPSTPDVVTPGHREREPRRQTPPDSLNSAYASDMAIGFPLAAEPSRPQAGNFDNDSSARSLARHPIPDYTTFLCQVLVTALSLNHSATRAIDVLSLLLADQHTSGAVFPNPAALLLPNLLICLLKCVSVSQFQFFISHPSSLPLLPFSRARWLYNEGPLMREQIRSRLAYTSGANLQGYAHAISDHL